jgi:hypothetical protein
MATRQLKPDKNDIVIDTQDSTALATLDNAAVTELIKSLKPKGLHEDALTQFAIQLNPQAPDWAQVQALAKTDSLPPSVHLKSAFLRGALFPRAKDIKGQVKAIPKATIRKTLGATLRDSVKGLTTTHRIDSGLKEPGKDGRDKTVWIRYRYEVFINKMEPGDIFHLEFRGHDDNPMYEPDHKFYRPVDWNAVTGKDLRMRKHQFTAYETVVNGATTSQPLASCPFDSNFASKIVESAFKHLYNLPLMRFAQDGLISPKDLAAIVYSLLVNQADKKGIDLTPEVAANLGLLAKTVMTSGNAVYYSPNDVFNRYYAINWDIIEQQAKRALAAKEIEDNYQF